MSQPQQKFRSFLSASLIFHAVVLTVLVLSFDFSGKMAVLQNSEKDMHVINAVVLDSLPTPKLPPKVVPASRPKVIEPTPPPPPPKPVEQKKVVEAVPPPPKAKTIAIPDPRKKQQELIEKQLLEDLNKQVKQQKKRKHQELERAFEKEIKQQAEKNLQQQLLSEQNRLSAVQTQQAQGEVDKYKALITQAIGSFWLIPATANKDSKVEILIRLAPGGMVLDAQIVKSSGDVALDRSARAAVFKASPLPVPTNPEAFASFRQFTLRARPQDILRQDNGLN